MACELPARFPHVELDEYVVMPNHFHGIIVIHKNECRDIPRGYSFPCEYPVFNGYPSACGHPDPAPERASARGAPTLGDVVGAFKSLSVNAWLKVIKTENINARGKFWQDNYYEHVLRNEEEMDRIRQYIVNNPLQWELDRENPLQGKQLQQPEKWMV